MKTISDLGNKLTRAAFTLLMMLAMTLTASATDFITDVMLLGHSDETTFNNQLSTLVTQQGWTDINQDLNAGAGGHYIHLLYKTQTSQGNSGTPITDFYIKTGEENPAATVEHDGRTYYLVPCQGSDNFVEGQGDLNEGCGQNSDYIHLYYTNDVLSSRHAVTAITFDNDQGGAVGENGGETGYDLNSGAHGDYIYMHFTTAYCMVVTLTQTTGEIQLQNSEILTGTGGPDTHVTIADGATVTFRGVDITAITNDNSHAWPGIRCLGDAVIILEAGTTNSVKGGCNSPGINLPQVKTLTIQGNGTLDATGGNNAAGIGGSQALACGNITITGGTVTAKGGNYAAGIGGGYGGAYQSACGDIIISGGTITATGGKFASGIGSGNSRSSCGDITISSGTVTATGGEEAAGIGSGRFMSSCGDITITNEVTEVTAIKGDSCTYAIGAGNVLSTCGIVTIGGVKTNFITESPFVTFPYNVAFDANGGTGTMADQVFMYNVAQNLTSNVFSHTQLMFEGWATSPNGPKVYDDEQSVINLYQNGSPMTLYAKWIDMAVLTSGSGEVLLQDGSKLTGTGGADTHVTIADGATVTLIGVNITAIANDIAHRWAGITCLGDAVIILEGGTTNNVKGGYYSSGIYVPANKTLTIQGSGTLNATGSENAAGIGGGYELSCGNITISGGIVTATKGTGNEYAIGAGTNGTCGTITIGSVQTGPIALSPFTTFPYTVAFDPNSGTGTMANQGFMYNVAQSLNPNSFTNSGQWFDGWATSTNGPKVYNDEDSVINLTENVGSTVMLYAKWKHIPIVVTLTTQSGEVLLRDGDTLTGTGGPDTHVSIADGATVILSGVDITAISNDDSHQWPGITCLGDAVIVLADNTTNNLKGGCQGSGIYVPGFKTLTIQGNGTLNVTGGNGAAGIGGGSFSHLGNIIISGGTVTATGGYGATGIGTGSSFSYCGDIIISGGTVTANGGVYAVGIGGGYNESSCQNITISGGTVTATGDYRAAGIGSSYFISSCGSITITNGVNRVTATAGQDCNNAIGAGNSNSTCGTVTIGGVQTGFITQSPFTTFPYTVSFDGNSGTGTMADQGFMYNVAQNLTSNSFTHTQFAFGGWATSADGPKLYDNGQSVSNLTETFHDTVTLYAKWAELQSIPLAVAGYGNGTGGWHLIASPIAGNTPVSDVTNLITTNSTYDLYYFDQTGGDNGAEWRNYKAHHDDLDNPFNALVNGQGYLYANSADVSLTFMGTPYVGDGQVTLSKDNDARLGQWNLIGNPFGTAATLGNKPFYRMNTPGTEIIASETSTVEAMEGIFVVAAEDGETVTFTQATRATDNDEGRSIVINLSSPSTGSGTAAVIDRAIVRFGEGQTLPKFQMRDNSTKVYIPQDGEDYAVVSVGRDGACTVSTGVIELPVNFKAAESGTYTLTISGTLNSQLSTLNLIDHLTGTNIDLLQTPSYTFTAKTTDYASRFKLVFNANENDNQNENENEGFAFISNGEIIINGEGVLQVIDVLGRTIATHRDGACTVSTDAMAPGVYVLRMINGEKVRTQKIVIQ